MAKVPGSQSKVQNYTMDYDYRLWTIDYGLRGLSARQPGSAPVMNRMENGGMEVI